MTQWNLGAVDQLRDGEMKNVEKDGENYLLARHDGKYRLMQCRCSHAGAKLSDGLLHDGQITCPWHHAVFDLASGRAVEPPAHDDLVSVSVREEDGELVADWPDEPERDLPTVQVDKQSETRVIVGAGAAARAAAEALRRAGFRGPVVMIGAEDRPPCDRTMLSKDYLVEGDPNGYLPLRDADFYRRLGIELRLGSPVRRVSIEDRVVEIEGAEAVRFGKALIATGAVPRRLEVPGKDLQGVFSLRSVEDADAIRAAAEGARRAVLVGSGFIGLECAASLAKRGLEVTVVSVESQPLERVVGPEVGKAIRNLHEKKNVTMRMEAELLRYEGEGGRVERVVVGDGTEIAADLVVEGVGVRPATDFLDDVKLADDGGVIVGSGLCVAGSGECLYAAGDVATMPLGADGNPVRIEHWRTAEQTGMRAGYAMAGCDVSLDFVPFFWSRQHGRSIQMTGRAEGWDETIVDGDLERPAFVAWYVRDDHIVAAVGVKREKDIMALSECLRAGRPPSKKALGDGSLNWREVLAS